MKKPTSENLIIDTSTGLSPQMSVKRLFPVPFGIYLHWPYCLSKCPYCDFYKEVRKDVPQEEIINGYLEELDFYHRLTADKTVSSIFFGGGTPSLIEPQYLEKIITYISKLWPMSSQVEISLEANPNSNKPRLFSDLKTAGINRLSLGVQALNEADLKFLGRTHNKEQALLAIEEVIKTFNNHSIDLIYARPQQDIQAWNQELQQAVSFGFKHISLYQLTIEEGTFFAKKGIKPLEEEAAATMYSLTADYLNTHGYPQYEVSNYGQPCRHNLLYWQGDDYLGIGKSAHGRFNYYGKIYASVHPRQLEELTTQERAEELVIMGLRLNSGINKQHFQEICGLDFDNFINQEQLHTLVQEQYIENTLQSIKATPKGFLVLNKLIEELCC